MVTPKIILNEDYLDLRKCHERSTTSKSNTGTHSTNRRKQNSGTNVQNLKSDGLRLEKELINCGLKKLVTSYNATAAQMNTQKQLVHKKKIPGKNKSKYDPRFRRFLVPEDKGRLNSVSDISITSKKPESLVPRKKTSEVEVTRPKEKLDFFKNKFTMTKCKNSSQDHELRQRHFDKQLADQEAPVVKQESNTGYSATQKEYKVNQQTVDPRLCEKYSILKMPWKRTWTIPVFSHKSSTLNTFKNFDHTDRQTYLYDDGTEIDSAYVEEKQKQIFSNVFQNQFMGILFLGGSICGILLVSLLIWFIFGFDFFRFFFKPKEVSDVPIKKVMKYIGGSVVYMIANFFRTIARILATPTQQVYQPPQDRYRWPASTLPA